MKQLFIIVAVSIVVIAIAACDHGLRIALDKGCTAITEEKCDIDEEGARDIEAVFPLTLMLIRLAIGRRMHKGNAGKQDQPDDDTKDDDGDQDLIDTSTVQVQKFETMLHHVFELIDPHDHDTGVSTGDNVHHHWIRITVNKAPKELQDSK